MLLTTSAANPVDSRVTRRYRDAALGDLAASATIVDAIRAKRGLVFFGPVGRGKTHAMCAVANALGGEGFIAWTEFLETIRAWWRLKTDDAHRFDPSRWAERTPFLFVDDVGTETSRGNVELGQEQFPAIMNARYKASLFTCLTTNLSVAELGKRYGERTVSRLAETSEWIEVGGPDRRMA